MIGWLLERLFIDKKGRAGRKKVKRLQQAPAVPAEAAATPAAEATAVEGAPVADPEREKLLNDAMTIFRQRRAEYEKLDDSVRAKIDKAASKAFGNDDT
jgi:hypothetical protein